jgi:WhiB family redox-sensing transcriptional regulator
MPSRPRWSRSVRLPVLTAADQGPWRSRAACDPSTIEMFFVPDDVPAREARRREQAAKRVCAGCPVRRQCLRYALDAGERYGVWGGLNPAERERVQPPARASRRPVSRSRRRDQEAGV